MSEYKIENSIDEILTGNMQKNALEFASFLRANKVVFERGKGYWKDKHYWMIKYENEFVCFILIGSEDKTKLDNWVIWSDDSDSNWFSDFPLNEHMKELAWKNVDICGNCGGCDNPGGTTKIIFGNNFNKVCRTTFKFINPDVETLDCVKKLIDIRKNDIIKK